MYFTFACTNCGKSLRGREENAGRKARCPYCKSNVTIPPSPLTVAAQEAARDIEPPPTAGPARPRRNPAISISASYTASPARRKISRRHREGEQADSTNVSMLLTALLGVVLTVAFYAALFPVPDNYFRQLFYNRGWVTVAETFLMFWSIGVLLFKTQKLFRQREAMLLDVLPESLAKNITAEKIDQFAQHISDLPIDPGFSFLVRRVLRGLEHFSVRRSASEVGTVLASQSEIDAHSVNSSYAMLNVFIWAIPILGFIGTVQGLGTAVGSLGVQDATDVDSIKESLGVDHRRPGGRLRYHAGGLDHEPDAQVPGQLAAEVRRGSAQLGRRVLQREPAETPQGGRLGRATGTGGNGPADQAGHRPEPGRNPGSHPAGREPDERTEQGGPAAVDPDRAGIVQRGRGAAVSLVDHLQLLEQAVINLNQVLGQLEGKQVVIQAARAPAHRRAGACSAAARNPRRQSG